MARTTATPARPVGAIALVAVGDLELHPRNPRRDPGDVGDLANSIRAHGILEPLVVVPADRAGKYLVVAGGRRLAAAKVAKLADVPVLVREDLDEQGAAAASLVENLQREDLDPIQEAEAYRDLLKLTGWQQKQLAEQLGVDATTVSHALRLLEAPKVVQDATRKGTIGAEHARVALGVPPAIASKLELKKGVTVEDLREQAAALTAEHAAREAAKDKLAKARADHERPEDGKLVTWGGELFAGRERIKLTDVLGAPPKRIVGILDEAETYTDVGNGRSEYLKGGAAIHDKVCECRVWAIAPTRSNYGADGAGTRTVRACVTPAGWAEYVKAARKATRKGRGTSAGGTTKAEREKAKRERERQVTREVEAILGGGRHLRGLSVLKKHGGESAVRKLTKGGVEGDGMRLVLFAITERTAGFEAAGPLWAKIAAMPRRQVQRSVLELGAAEALDGGGVNRDAVVDRILEHYKIVTPAAADENGDAE